MAKFKWGDLVEICNLVNVIHLNGMRFTVTESFKGEARCRYTQKISYGVFYLEPFEGTCVEEKNLRKVNPDGDELSDMTYEELISSLKSPAKQAEPV